MLLRLAVLKSIFDTYNTKAFSMVFLFIAIGYLIVKDKKEQKNLLIYEIFGIILLVTPFIGNKILTIGAGAGSNWQAYGILCAIPVTAFVVVEVLKSVGDTKKRVKLSLVFLLALQMGLGFFVTGEQFGLPQNLGKLSETAVSIGQKLAVEEGVYVMAPAELAAELREYSTDIRVFYNAGFEEMQKDLNLLQGEADYYGCNCVIIKMEYDNEEKMLTGGYEKTACIENYVIYRRTDL